MNENIDKSRTTENTETLTEIIEPVSRLADAPPAGEPDDGIDQYCHGDSG
jgi:hypothetical protein